ncbi:MAG: response regulator [Alphaproteobacteria bacterium]|nr:response regulator [Alphaproteobacteria bacterium]
MIALGNPASTPPSSFLRAKIRAYAAAVLVCTALGLGIGWELWSSYDATLTAAKERARSTTYLLGESIKAAFRESDFVLKDVVGHVVPGAIHYPETDQKRYETVRDLLRNKSQSLPSIRGIGIWNERCVASYAAKREPGLDYSNSPDCTTLRDDPGRDIFVTGVYRGPQGSPQVSINRKVRDSQGRFAGFVSMCRDMSDFGVWLKNIDVGQDGTAIIADDDLHLIARKPALPVVLYDAPPPDRDAPRQMPLVNDVLRDLLAAGNTDGEYVRRSSLDGRDRIYSFRKLESLPFVVMVGLDRQHTLAKWQHESYGFALGGVLIVMLALLLVRQHLATVKQADTLAWLSIAVNAAGEAVVITDSQGVIEFVNPCFTMLTGYEATEAIGRTPALLNSGKHDPALFTNLWTTISTGNIWRGEVVNRKKNGEHYTEVMTVAPVAGADGKPGKFVAIKHDFTERKRMEEELRDLAQEAQAAGKAKEEFLAVMSHEIRTPMNGILGMVQILLGRSLPAEVRQELETVRGSGEALRAVLDGILDFSKLQAGQMRFERMPFDLHDLVKDVAQLMEPNARAKTLAFSHTIDPAVPRWVVGDPVRLRQILLNLSSNAVKFTAAGGISIGVQPIAGAAAKGEAITLEFSIFDTGIGIDESQQALLFDSFSQADASISRRFGGTGLGLAICKQLVEGQGGRIGVESQLGHGSRFWFQLGFGEVTNVTPSVQRREILLPPLSILLAEDDLINQKVATGLLSRDGHQITIANNGREAIFLAQTQRFDVALLDMHMPEMDGLEACRRIRALPGAVARLPILALSASARHEDVERCRAAGMDGHVAKPIDMPALRAALAEVLNLPVPDSSQTVMDQGLLAELSDKMGRNFVKELVTMFLTLGPVECQRLKEMAMADPCDLRAIHEVAHTLKGMASSIGCRSLVTLAASLEVLASETGGEAEIIRLVAGIDDVWAATATALAPMIAT